MLKWFYTKGVVQFYHELGFHSVRRSENIVSYINVLEALNKGNTKEALDLVLNKKYAFCDGAETTSLFEKNLQKSSIPLEIIQFVKDNALEITTDGCFVGFKNVNIINMCDHYTGQNFHYTGAVIQMDRHLVNADPTVSCGTGLHVGTAKYVSTFKQNASVTFLVKVNPKNVVCVPNGNEGKIRCCEYTVMEPTTLDNMVSSGSVNFNPSKKLSLDEIMEIVDPVERRYYYLNHKADTLEASLKNLRS